MASYDIIVKLVDQTKTGLRNIESGLTTIQNRAEQVNKTLDKLGAGLNKASIVAAGALSLAAKSAISYADAIQDASNASGIATPTILAFSQSVATSGGDATRAVDAMIRFADAVGTAATGSYESRKAFDAVGISLQDLRTLSEEDLFKKAIAGLASIEDLSIRASVQNNIFGKTLKGVDVGGFAKDLDAAAAAQQRNASAIKEAAGLVDQLKIAYGKLELAILRAIKPFVEQVNKLTPEQIDKLVDGILKLGVGILAISGSVKIIGTLSTALGYLGTAATVAWGIFKYGTDLVSKGAGLIAASWLTVSNLFKNIFQLWTIGWTSLTGIIGRVGTTISAIAGGAGLLLPAIARIAAGFTIVGGVITAVTGVAYLLDKAFESVFDWSPIQTFTNKLGGAYDALKNWLGLKDKAQGSTAGAGRGSYQGYSAEADAANKAKMAAEEAAKAAKNAIKPDPNIEALTDQLKKASEEYGSFSAVAKDTKNLNLASLAFSRLSSAAETLGQVAVKPTALILRDFNLELSKQEETLRRESVELGNAALQARAFELELIKGAQELDRQSARLSDVARTTNVWSQAIEKTALDLKEQGMKLANNSIQTRIYANEITAMNQQLLDQKQRLADSTLQQAIYNDELGKGALALKDQEQRLGNIALQQGLFDQGIQKSRNDLNQQKITLDLLNEAYDKGVISLQEYADALGGINSQLIGSKQLMSQALNDANKEVKLTQDRKLALAQLIDKYKEAGGTGTAAFRKAAEALGGTGPQVQAVINKYGDYADKVKEYNQEVEDSINKASGTFVDEFTAAFMKGEGMLDSFRNFFSNVMNDIAQRIIKKQLTEPIADALNGLLNDLMKSSGGIGSVLGNIFSGGGGGAGGGLLGGLGGLLGNAWSGITNFFGGLFADGGSLPAGKFGIVGEKGPEFITGPANIAPMDQMTAGATAPSVNFTINAIDTQTGVQFLLQNKPAIVSMVSQAYNERGRRGVNG